MSFVCLRSSVVRQLRELVSIGEGNVVDDGATCEVLRSGYAGSFVIEVSLLKHNLVLLTPGRSEDPYRSRRSVSQRLLSDSADNYHIQPGEQCAFVFEVLARDMPLRSCAADLKLAFD